MGDLHAVTRSLNSSRRSKAQLSHPADKRRMTLQKVSVEVHGVAPTPGLGAGGGDYSPQPTTSLQLLEEFLVIAQSTTGLCFAIDFLLCDGCCKFCT